VIQSLKNVPFYLTQRPELLEDLKRASTIVLDLVLELVDHGKRFRCAALIDTRAMGLFISRDYAAHVQTQLHQLESLVTVQSIDGTEN
jgi:hypothetical protein